MIHFCFKKCSFDLIHHIIPELLYFVSNQNNSAFTPNFFHQTVFVSGGEIAVINFSIFCALRWPKTENTACLYLLI